MRKKIAAEFAIGFILVAAIIVGVIITMQSWEMESAISTFPVTKMNVKKHDKNVSNAKNPIVKSTCVPRYYEGKEELHAWRTPMDNSKKSGEIIVSISGDDLASLPSGANSGKVNEGEFVVKIVDPSDEVVKKLDLASKANPTTIEIQGYAQTCTEPPLVSLKPATIAFKKS